MAKRTAKPKPNYVVSDLWPLLVRLNSVTLDPKNAKEHTSSGIGTIAASLERYKQRKPIVIHAETGIVEAGNGTVRAARQLGWEWIAAVRVHDDPATQSGFSLADNRAAEFSEWNNATLTALLLDIQAEDAAFTTDFGWSELIAVETAISSVKPVEIKPAAPRCWVLIGLPTVQWGQIVELIERIGALENVIIETTMTDERPNP